MAAAKEAKVRPDESKEEDAEQKVAFSCGKCGLTESADYFGTIVPFAAKKVALNEEAYVMKDPFQPWGSGHFLILGGVCCVSECAKSICMDCSVFYKHRFCLDCAQSPSIFGLFPKEFQARIVKKADSKS